MAETLAQREELFTEREVLEGMTPDQLTDLILEHGAKVSEIERVMNLASDVLEGTTGKTVEQMLSERETQNGKT